MTQTKIYKFHLQKLFQNLTVHFCLTEQWFLMPTNWLGQKKLKLKKDSYQHFCQLRDEGTRKRAINLKTCLVVVCSGRESILSYKFVLHKGDKLSFLNETVHEFHL